MKSERFRLGWRPWLAWFAAGVFSSWLGMSLHPMDYDLEPVSASVAAGRFIFLAMPLAAAFWLTDSLRKYWPNLTSIRFIIAVGALWIAGLILPIVFWLLLGQLLDALYSY
jgi:hypothetical protein